MQKGIVHFLPLLIVAVLLVGVVGYVSVKEIRNDSGSEVLSESAENDSDFDSSDFDNEDDSLEGVGELEVDIPNFEKESPTPKAMFKPTPKPVEAQDDEPIRIEDSIPEVPRRGFLFDFFDSLLRQLNSLRF